MKYFNIGEIKSIAIVTYQLYHSLYAAKSK